MKTTTRIFLITGLMATLLVSGCGGSDDEDTVATAPPGATSVPDSAGTSANAFITFLMTLNPNDETSEPLTLGSDFAVPNDDAGVPQPLV